MGFCFLLSGALYSRKNIVRGLKRRRIVVKVNSHGDIIMFCRTLDLSLDIVDGVGRFHLKGDGLPRERFHKDLHDGLDE